MRVNHVLLAIAVSFGVCLDAGAQTSQLRVRALRQARKMVKSSPAGEVSALTNTNFDGIWGGRYVYSSSASSCATRLTSFNYRHVLVTNRGSGYLSTNHDGDFTGRSRDRGRRWEFVKGNSVGGRPAALAVVYQSLARNGNTAATAAAVSISGGCLVSYGANSIRLAR